MKKLAAFETMTCDYICISPLYLHLYDIKYNLLYIYTYLNLSLFSKF